MKSNWRKQILTLGLLVASVGAPVCPPEVLAQFGAPPMGVPTTPEAQRNALNNLRSRVGWVRNATRSASSYADGAGLLWQQFQYLRASFSTFTMTLNAQQQYYGGNEVAELGAGLDIIQEAFTNYQDDISAGRAPAAALSDLCQVLNQAAAAWLQQLNRDSARLRVGW